MESFIILFLLDLQRFIWKSCTSWVIWSIVIDPWVGGSMLQMNKHSLRTMDDRLESNFLAFVVYSAGFLRPNMCKQTNKQTNKQHVQWVSIALSAVKCGGEARSQPVRKRSRYWSCWSLILLQAQHKVDRVTNYVRETLKRTSIAGH